MIRTYLQKILNDEDLSQKEAQDLFKIIYQGKVCDIQLTALLVALKMKGVMLTETVGMLSVIRANKLKIKIPKKNTVDLCGTGGGIVNTINVSTLAAFITAGAGAVVTKQVNHAVTGQCGSADLLQAMGFNLEKHSPEKMAKVIKQYGLGFLYTPKYNNNFVNIFQPITKKLNVDSIYNVLIPITNLSDSASMVIGVNNPSLTTLVAQTLREIGVERAFVVNGAPAIDEISIVGPTKISQLIDGKIKVYTVKPEDFGYETGNIEEIIASEDIKDNLIIAERILSGKEQGTTRVAMVLLNAAFAIVVAGLSNSIEKALLMAEQALYSGIVFDKYQRLKKVLK